MKLKLSKAAYLPIMFSVIILLLSSCTDNPKHAEESKGKPDTASVTLTHSANESTDSWVDDLKNFRTAIQKNDLAQLKTYFAFPLVNDTTQIWTAVYDNVDEDKQPTKINDTFTENDFEQHYQSLFNQPFINSLNKVDLQTLSKQNEYTTADIKGEDSSYHMLASFNKATATLELAVSYSGALDEDGTEISETEHAIIYLFKVVDNKYLKFDKILFAG